MDNNGYRPQWVQDILGKRSLLDCALDVHMTVAGTYERCSGGESPTQEDDISALQHSLDNWKPSWPGQEAFDNAVRKLLQISLEEASK